MSINNKLDSYGDPYTPKENTRKRKRINIELDSNEDPEINEPPKKIAPLGS